MSAPLGSASALGPEIIELEIIPDALLRKQVKTSHHVTPGPPQPPPKPETVEIGCDPIEIVPQLLPVEVPKLTSKGILVTGVVLFIAISCVVAAMGYPDWRHGQFPKPDDQEAIYLGLFDITVPYAWKRRNAYSSTQSIFDPSSAFKDWNRTAGEVGVEWTSDRLGDVRKAHIATLTTLLCGLMSNVVCYLLFTFHVRILSWTVFLSGLLYISSACFYMLFLYNGIDGIREDNVILAADSVFGVSFYLVGSAGALLCLLTLCLYCLSAPTTEDGSQDESSDEEEEEEEVEEEEERTANYSPRT